MLCKCAYVEARDSLFAARCSIRVACCSIKVARWALHCEHLNVFEVLKDVNGFALKIAFGS